MYRLSLYISVAVALLATVSFKHGTFAENNISSFSNNSERIITKLGIIYNSSGVPLDYSYNESTSNDLTSAPGCPKSIDGIPWIYYGEPPRCFLAAHYGPCPKEQKLLVVKGSPFGVCACECIVDGEYNPYFQSNSRIKPRYIFCKNPSLIVTWGHIYDTKEFKCFERCKQGPCKNGEVLVGHKPFELECLPKYIGKGDYYNVSHAPVSSNGMKCRLFPDRNDENSLSEFLEVNRCPSGEKYSATLRKCIKKELFILP